MAEKTPHITKVEYKPNVVRRRMQYEGSCSACFWRSVGTDKITVEKEAFDHERRMRRDIYSGKAKS